MKPTKPSIIPDGATTSAPARACDSATRPRFSSVASLSTSPSIDHAAVAVGGVLVEAGVEDHRQLGDRLLDRAGRLLHQAVVVPGVGADRVLLLGDAEQDHRRDAEAGTPWLRPPLRRPRPATGRASTRWLADALAGDDEQRVDEVVGGEGVSRTRRRMAGLRRSRRGRVSGNDIFPEPSLSRPAVQTRARPGRARPRRRRSAQGSGPPRCQAREIPLPGGSLELDGRLEGIFRAVLCA